MKLEQCLSFSAQSIDRILTLLQTSITTGLSSEEVKKRIQMYGYNEIKEKPLSWFSILFRQIANPFMLVFFVIALFYLISRDIQHTVLIMSIIGINVFIGFYQEFKSEKTVRALKKLLIIKTIVMRDNSRQNIPTRELVPGDIIIMYPGDIIPADCRIVESNNLIIDESTLTGESSPKHKNNDTLATQPEHFFDAYNIGFAGTTITSGKMIGVIITTGKETQLGAIAYLTTKTIKVSALAKSTGLLARFILQLILITLAISITLNIIIKYGTPAFSLYNLIIFCTSLAITAIPEALPFVITFCMAQGASVLAKNRVIVKRLTAIEDLGSIEILCTDKTGTVTENCMQVTRIYNDNHEALLYCAYIIPNKTLVEKNNLGFDSAIWAALTPEQQAQASMYTIKKEVPFNPTLRVNLSLGVIDNTIIIIARGPVELITNLCTQHTFDIDQLNAWTQQEESAGSRVLAVAHKTFTLSEESHAQSFLDQPHDMTFVGLVSFIDPIKKTALHAVQKAMELNITLKMISGDSPTVCKSVAHQLGIQDHIDTVITGYEYAKMSPEEQLRVSKEHALFSRITPEQKYSIITNLQDTALVGYLGDGINDVPALKAATVSLAVQDAVDIAQQTADIILLNKSLNDIINGIQEGRKIFINTVKYITITISANFGNFFSLTIASLILPYLPMLPFQLLLVNVLSDLPMIAIATDTVAPEELKRVGTFNIKEIALISIIFGCVSSFFDFIIFALFQTPHNPAILQTCWFMSSILTELVLIFSLRTKLLFFKAKRPSVALIATCLIVAFITIGLPFTSFGQNTLQFVALSPRIVGAIMSIIVLYFITTEIIKWLFFSIFNKKQTF